MIFRHQHGDAKIEAKDVRVVPICERVESVAEAVLGPHLFAVRAAEMAQHADAIVEEKRKGAAGGARDDSAIYRANRAASRIRAAPRGVAFYVVGGADAPKMFDVIRKLIVQGKTKKFVGLGGFHGILKIIGVGIAFVAVLKPGMRISVGE